MVTSAERHIAAPALPALRSPLLGREQDIDALREYIEAGETLVTVIGPGGVGKTSLALSVAHDLAALFDDAVAFVPLASIRDPHLVLPEIGSTLGFTGDPFDDYGQRLVAYMEGQRALVVLDNLEQVMDAVPALERLHTALPGITLLVTSRIALGIPGEVVYPLAPLPVTSDHAASPDSLLHTDAVSLFVQRARAADPNLHLDDDTVRVIARICERLDGLPLAIELAAARMNVMTPQELQRRIEESFGILGGAGPQADPRHRTIRETVAWSYDLLPVAAQTLLHQLAVFEGGFSGDVLPFLETDPAVLDILVSHSLVTKSGERRYLMLESVRDYARDQMRIRQEEQAFRELHAEYVARLAESVDLDGPEQLAWGARLDAGLANIRSAVDWIIASGRRDLLLRIMSGISHYLSSRLYLTEARAWMLEALRDTTQSLYRERVSVLLEAGLLWTDSNDDDEGMAFYSQARYLAAAMGDRQLEGKAVSLMGSLYTGQGRNEEALAHFREAITIVQENEFPYEHARILSNMGNLLFYMGRPLEAMDAFRRSSRVFREFGDETFVALDLIKLGTVAADIGRYDEAEDSLKEGVARVRKAKNLRVLGSALGPLAQVFLVRGELQAAEGLFRELRDLHRKDGIAKMQAEGWIGLAYVELERNDARRAAEFLIEALDLVVDDMKDNYTIAPEDLAALLLATSGDVENAARIFGYIEKSIADSGEGVSDFNQRLLTRIETAIREELSPVDLEALTAEGSRFPEEGLNRELQRLLRRVIGRQQPAVDPERPDDIPEAAPVVNEFGLTPREMETLQHLAEGRSTREIAGAMGVSDRTVATHIANILAKMDVGSRTAAVARAMRSGSTLEADTARNRQE